MNRERENAKVELDGSAESRAIARLLAQQRTAKPKLSQFDEDAHLIYCQMSCPGFGLPCGYTLAPSSGDIQHTAVYARGMEVSEMLRGPVIPAHRLGPLDLSLDEIPTIPALTFEGVGPWELYGGIVENRHRCRPATEEEMQKPEIEPPKDSLLELLQRTIAPAESARSNRGKNPSGSVGASR